MHLAFDYGWAIRPVAPGLMVSAHGLDLRDLAHEAREFTADRAD